MARLSDLHPGQSGRVVALRGDSATIQRLAELGILEEETVEVVRLAPTGDPMELRIGASLLSVRRQQATCVEVEPLEA
jgi:Fe2+ transport system protein FeoA